MADDTTPTAFIVGMNDEGTRIRLPIRDRAITIGRDPTNAVCLADDQLISRFHCTIQMTDAGLVIKDLNSSNGTYLGDRRVGGAVPLPIPSAFTVGDTQLAVVPAPQTAEPARTIVASAATPAGSVIMPALSSFSVQTESMLVADIVDSTGLLARSEVSFAKAVLTLEQLFERGLQGEADPFLQCTGDGFFACFRDPEVALDVATRLGPGVARHVLPTIRVSAALHWGPTRNTGKGGKAGKDVYAVFSLDKVRHAVPEIEATSHAPGNETVVLMTQTFWEQLQPTRRATARSVGAFRLRGLSEDENILYWQAPARASNAPDQPFSQASNDGTGDAS